VETPKRFSVKEKSFSLLPVYFVFVRIIFDHTVGIKPFDFFYDVNDSFCLPAHGFLVHRIIWSLWISIYFICMTASK